VARRRHVRRVVEAGDHHRPGQARVRSGVHGHHLQHDLWPRRQLQQPRELVVHDLRAADRAAQRPLVHYGDQHRRIVAVQDLLAVHPGLHLLVDLRVGLARLAAPQYLMRVPRP
jgi:hypothetical protein